MKRDQKNFKDEFYTSADFDRELERNKSENKSTLRSPFDIDPEEGMDMIQNGFRKIIKKTKKVFDKFEDKCNILIHGADNGEKDINNHEQHENVDNLGKDIKYLYGGVRIGKPIFANNSKSNI